MLAVLGGLVDVGRDLIRTRTAEGRSRAKTAERGHQTARAGRDVAGIADSYDRSISTMRRATRAA
jgi:hypothetical protein